MKRCIFHSCSHINTSSSTLREKHEKKREKKQDGGGMARCILPNERMGKGVTIVRESYATFLALADAAVGPRGHQLYTGYHRARLERDRRLARENKRSREILTWGWLVGWLVGWLAGWWGGRWRRGGWNEGGGKRERLGEQGRIKRRRVARYAGILASLAVYTCEHVDSILGPPLAPTPCSARRPVSVALAQLAPTDIISR
jgi:hypothetical protein